MNDDLRADAIAAETATAAARQSAVDRSRAPDASAPSGYSFPEIIRHRTSFGLEIIMAPERRDGATNPLVSIEAVVPAGAQIDPPDLAGRASLVAGLLDEGTERYDALELASAAETIGARLGTGADWNLAAASIRVLDEFTAEGLDLLVEVLCRPRFDEGEVERLRRQRLTDLIRRKDSPASLATDHFGALIYGTQTYGRPLVGTAETVGDLDRESIVDLYRSNYRLASTKLLASGHFEPAALIDLVAERFAIDADGGDGSATADSGVKPNWPNASSERKIRIIDRPSAAQTELRLGHVGIPRTDPDWTTLKIANTLFGGKFTSRINLNLREKHGFTYGVSSRMIARLGPAPTYVASAIETQSIGTAVEQLLMEIGRMRDEPVGLDELEDAQNYLIGVFPNGIQTVDGMLDHLDAVVLYELGDDYFQPEVYPQRIRSVSRADIQRVARKHWRPEQASIVAVGPAEALVPQLEPFGEPEVVTADEQL